MSRVVPASHTETQLDELLRNPQMHKIFSREDILIKLMSSNSSTDYKQTMIYHLQTLKWYLNH